MPMHARVQIEHILALSREGHTQTSVVDGFLFASAFGAYMRSEFASGTQKGTVKIGKH